MTRQAHVALLNLFKHQVEATRQRIQFLDLAGLSAQRVVAVFGHPTRKLLQIMQRIEQRGVQTTHQGATHQQGQQRRRQRRGQLPKGLLVKPKQRDAQMQGTSGLTAIHNRLNNFNLREIKRRPTRKRPVQGRSRRFWVADIVRQRTLVNAIQRGTSDLRQVA